MDVVETDLPGVGKKHEMVLRSGDRAVVVTHSTGKRELFRGQPEADDRERVFVLTDGEARVLGSVLEGAYFQPVASEDVDTALAGDLIFDWLELDPHARVVGETAGEAVPAEITVLAIVRDGDVLSGEPPDDAFEAGDVLIMVGERDACMAFEDRIAPEG